MLNRSLLGKEYDAQSYVVSAEATMAYARAYASSIRLFRETLSTARHELSLLRSSLEGSLLPLILTVVIRRARPFSTSHLPPLSETRDIALEREQQPTRLPRANLSIVSPRPSTRIKHFAMRKRQEITIPFTSMKTSPSWQDYRALSSTACAPWRLYPKLLLTAYARKTPAASSGSAPDSLDRCSLVRR